MGEYKTPGVYIKEINAFPNSVVEAETAIPAFIGITEKAQNESDVLTGKPWKITSMTEFVKYFGGAPEFSFTVDIKTYGPTAKKENGMWVNASDVKKPLVEIFQDTLEIEEEDNKNGYAFCLDWTKETKDDKQIVVSPFYTLYYNMSLFFANGGGTCYIVSIANYADKENLDAKEGGNYKVVNALSELEKVQEVTMIVVPELVNIKIEDYRNIQQQILKHCGEKMKNRFALLDVFPKENENIIIDKQIEVFQSGIGSEFLSYGAAYFPWLNTSVVSDRDIEGKMFTWTDTLYTHKNKFTTVDPNLHTIIEMFMLPSSIDVEKDNTATIGGKEYAYDKISKELLEKDLDHGVTIEVTNTAATEQIPEKKTITFSSHYAFDKKGFHLALLNGSVIYQYAMKELKRLLNLLPPSAAMAGIYTMVDNTRGVWKAPANISVNYVDSPVEDIDDEAQNNLNAPMNGKAINVIRAFQGEGLKVWGARTLDGNSLDWRYINVRRTLLFLEESVKNAARAYVFEPNDAGTWINMKCMIENFLRGVWKRGGLAGATPEDAYEVHVGLGDTMTAEDILEGIMRITVLVAVTHPAEFIEITFQQQAQKN